MTENEYKVTISTRSFVCIVKAMGEDDAQEKATEKYGEYVMENDPLNFDIEEVDENDTNQ